ncbi:hypothetical protein [Mesorhizobium sp.]|uniref:hypothetical protein n=1 Tax=Mesorhizobium sp. TaxID=1871066 RepID=UPI0025EF94FE|nr:hypothetical protein [Mesorhizobium sp.]
MPRSTALFIDRGAAGMTASGPTVEQEALLAICSYPAISRGDRRAKAEYLLGAEAKE